MRKKRPNCPYIAGKPIKNIESFFGRGDILEWVQGQLLQDRTQSLLLWGPRRVGKTSVMERLVTLLSDQGFITVPLSLSSECNKSLGQFLLSLTARVSKASDETVVLPPSRSFEEEPEAFYQELLPKLYQTLSSEKRIVFLVDEFDVLTASSRDYPSMDPSFQSLPTFLSAWMDHDPHTVFIFFTGTSFNTLPAQIKQLLKSATAHKIWVLDEKDARGVILQAEKNRTLRFKAQAVNYILDFTHRYPYFLQLVCKTIWDHAYNIDRNPNTLPQIGLDDIEEVLPKVLDQGAIALSWWWDGFSPAEQVCAAAIAELTRKEAACDQDALYHLLLETSERLCIPDVYETGLTRLTEQQIIRKNNKQYRLTIPLLAQWIQREHALVTLVNTLDQCDPIAFGYFEEGEKLARLGKWVDAIEAYRNALKKNPQLVRAYIGLGKALLKTGKTEEAVTEIAQAYAFDRDSVKHRYLSALFKYAREKKQAGEIEQALALCNRLLDIDPAHPKGQSLKAELEKLADQNMLEVIPILENVGMLIETRKFEDALSILDESLSIATGAEAKLLQQKRHEVEQNRIEYADDLVAGIDDYLRESRPDFDAIRRNLNTLAKDVYTDHPELKRLGKFVEQRHEEIQRAHDLAEIKQQVEEKHNVLAHPVKDYDALWRQACTLLERYPDSDQAKQLKQDIKARRDTAHKMAHIRATAGSIGEFEKLIDVYRQALDSGREKIEKPVLEIGDQGKPHIILGNIIPANKAYEILLELVQKAAHQNIEAKLSDARNMLDKTPHTALGIVEDLLTQEGFEYQNLYQFMDDSHRETLKSFKDEALKRCKRRDKVEEALSRLRAEMHLQPEENLLKKLEDLAKQDSAAPSLKRTREMLTARVSMRAEEQLESLKEDRKNAIDLIWDLLGEAKLSEIKSRLGNYCPQEHLLQRICENDDPVLRARVKRFRDVCDLDRQVIPLIYKGWRYVTQEENLRAAQAIIQELDALDCDEALREGIEKLRQAWETQREEVHQVLDELFGRKKEILEDTYAYYYDREVAYRGLLKELKGIHAKEEKILVPSYRQDLVEAIRQVEKTWVEETDKALEKYCGRDYLPLREVERLILEILGKELDATDLAAQRACEVLPKVYRCLAERAVEKEDPKAARYYQQQSTFYATACNQKDKSRLTELLAEGIQEFSSL